MMEQGFLTFAKAFMTVLLLGILFLICFDFVTPQVHSYKFIEIPQLEKPITGWRKV